MKMRAFTLTAIAALVAAAPLASQAEVTLLKADPQANDPLSRLDFKVGGSIRPQFMHQNGVNDKSYKRNGYDGGSRFRFTANYYLFDDVSWVGYYELGVNFPAWWGWDNHYADGANNTTRRQLYTGFKSATLGELYFGQQNSVYYDVVGAKTDIWDYDMLAQAPGNGINGDYDGSYRSRKQLKYKNTFGDVDVYASYLFEDNDYLPGKGMRYKRKGGGSLGVNYHITKDLAWGTAWNYTRADIHQPSTGDSKTYDQNIYGTALSWTPGHWTLSAGGGYYQNFLSTKTSQVHNYFADDAWGLEYFAGYKFPIGQYAVKSIQPYFMGDRLEYLNGRNYKRIDNGLGVSFQLDYGFRVDYEYVITSSTDKSLGNVNLVRLRYDF
ncbi:MAG: porin [Pantoea sp.]|uniref:Porin n=1 Tax=Pantoea phytobeneficialis TaxID=2052056 RepID=A0AAP9H2S0_9GAMM|nr:MULTISPECIES: porin [Pantoea]ERK12418.1 putative outer membrane protein [Pantoea sp. AS-PWVM4]MDO6407716.1 porin [Pantoea phytobeneficialis]QGR05483.1 porin [Pantoea phytobeneficialis]